MLQALVPKHGGALRSTLHRLGSEQSLLCYRFRGNRLGVQSGPRCMFATSCPRFVAKKARSSLKNPKNPSKHTAQVASPAALVPSYRSFAETLALRQSPTLLFQASSHRGYLIACYVLGSFCFTYVALNFNTYLHPPEDIWAPIPIAIGGVCVFMACIGVWFILRPARIIRTITAIPPTSNARIQGLVLQIETIAVIPGRKPNPFMVAPRDVTLSSPLFNRENELSLAAAKESRRRFERMCELNKTRILTLPFRQLKYLLWKAFRNLRTMMSPEQFLYMRVKGRNGVWKITHSAAWALEDGKAIDKLVKHNL